jgi:hypothetical protein
MAALRETFVGIVAGCAAVLRDVSAYKLCESQPDDAPMLPSYWASSSPLSFLPPIRALPDVTALSCTSTMCPPAQLRRPHYGYSTLGSATVSSTVHVSIGPMWVRIGVLNRLAAKSWLVTACKPLRRLLTDIRWRPLSVGCARRPAASEPCTSGKQTISSESLSRSQQ